jgi:hypothetical protein
MAINGDGESAVACSDDAAETALEKDAHVAAFVVVECQVRSCTEVEPAPHLEGKDRGGAVIVEGEEARAR